MCPIGRFWVQVLRASADGQRGLDTDPSETGGPCSQGRLRLRPQLRPRRPARPRPRPPARSLPGLREHSIHSAAGLGRSRSRSQSRAGPGSRRRQRGDAGERGRAGERCASRGPGRPAARAAPPSGLCAATGRPAGRGGRGNGRRGGASTLAALPRVWGAAPQAPERRASRSPGLAGGPAPRLGASGASCPPRGLPGPPSQSRLCAGGAPAPGGPPESSLSSPASPRGPVTLAAPPSSSSRATSAPFPGPCHLPCWTPAGRPVGGSSPSSLSGGPGGSASEQGVLRGGPLSRRAAPSLAGTHWRPPVALG